jgi:protein-arginine kinase activator protein McsA
MLESVEREDYERASELRDQIKMIEEAKTDDRA